jgi:hydrophobe/amphiphile efflux-1 (HAE1) family protein
MFTHFFIRRPVFASVCSLIIILIGMVGYTRLPLQEYPSIDPPAVNVSTTYPGANPRVVETEITDVLEDAINGIEGVKTMRSESRESVSSITVEFELSRNIEEAAQDVRSRVDRAIGNLPDDAETPVVSKRDGDSSPILWFAVYSDKFSSLELSDYVDRYVTDILETVPGVSNIIIRGERRYAIRVWLDPAKLAARNLTVLDVEQTLREQNVEIPSGRIEGNTLEYSVRTLGRLQTPQEYQSLVIRKNPDSSPVYLGDLGRVEIGAEDDRSFVRFKGINAVGLGVVKISKSNTLDVANGVKAKMAELAQNFPEGLNYQLSFDTSTFISLAIKEVWHSLYLSIFLVILVIFFFLRDWRATLVPAVTIPISLIGAFGIMFALGYSINTLTLFSLTLATGLVVDDTIVVLENIVRYIQEKKMSPYQAAMAGVGEVVFAVIATTVVLVAVFVPIGFSSGTIGRLLTEFSITLAGSVVISTIVALTLAPPLSARILKNPASTTHSSRKSLLNIFFGYIEVFLRKVERSYRWSLVKIMPLKFVMVGGFFISLVLTVRLFQQIPQGFLPTEDRGSIFTIVRAPQGVSLSYTDNLMRQVEEVYSQVPEVETYFTVGAFGRGTAGEVNQGIALVRLKDWSQRQNPDQSQQEIINRLRPKFGAIPDGIVLANNPSSLPGAGFGQAVEFVLQGPDFDELAEVSEEFTRRAQELPQLVNVDTDLTINKPELTISIDRNQAANLGISVRDIARTMQILLGGQKITNFNQGNRRYEVVVQAEKEFRSTPEDIRQLYVRNREGQVVPLSNLVTITPDTTPPQINHFNRFRAARISGSVAPGFSLGEALDALENLAKEVLPADMRTALSGQSLEFKEAGQSTIFTFALSLAFIFLVLAAQFESYIDPIIILLAVPLSLLGAFVALIWAGLELDIFSQIGLIMLIGLATKNSILIVEFANQLREQGMSITKAAISASELRFRPILMTAFSTIFGILPLAFATGAGAASRVSLGMTVVGGMFVSTLLSLYVIPVFYVIAIQAQYRLMHHGHKEKNM